MITGLGVAWLAILASPSIAQTLSGQTPAFSINPGKLEIEVNPGAQKTVAFEIAGAPAQTPERGRIIVSPTDWGIAEDGSLLFQPPGSEAGSASAWTAFSPSSFTLEAGRMQQVRATVSVPANTPPGVYRTGLFVQERPPATPPLQGTQSIQVRIRYVFLLYVIVGPVAPHAELVNVDMNTGDGGIRFICEMKNTGTRHARPIIYWSIRRGISSETRGKTEATVLLPFSTMREAYSLEQLHLPKGVYQASITVDFQDGQPQQSMSREFEVAAPEAEKRPAGN